MEDLRTVGCFRTYQRDGPMTVTNNQAGAPNYFPNSFSGPRSDLKYQEHRTSLAADVTRWNSADEDNFTQVFRQSQSSPTLSQV